VGAAQALSWARHVVPMDSIVLGWSTMATTALDGAPKPGEYAVRGGILICFRRSRQPVRFDFFGDSTRIDPPRSMRKPSARCSHARASIWYPVSDSSSSPKPSAASHGLCRDLRAPQRDDLLYEA